MRYFVAVWTLIVMVMAVLAVLPTSEGFLSPTTIPSTAGKATCSSTTMLHAAKSKEEDLELTRQVIAQFMDGGGSSADAAAKTTTTEEPPTVAEAEDSTKKQEKKKPKKQQQQAPAGDDTIDISKLDIRVGLITKAWDHPDADKLYCEEIDIGEDSGPRSISSGLRYHYDTADDLLNKRVLVLANLKSRKLVGFPSHGMVLCASQEGGKVELIEPPKSANIGDRITAKGFEGEPATENQILKKKMLDAVFPDLNTNENGVPCYKGVPLGVVGSDSDDYCTSSLPNVPVG